MLLFIILIPFIYIFIKLVLYFLSLKYGKISYDGFNALGFGYDVKKDIFYSTRNAWQKNFGYSHIYDVSAPLFNMIIDTEPIHFYYNNKNWLLSFWKGQYGIVTGAEIGIYATKERKVNKNTLYLPVKPEEMLDMSFILYNDKKEITRVKGHHWWLTSFKLGMFSKPKDLSMDIKITFPNKLMLDAFLNSFYKIGYTNKNCKIIDNSFYFTFKKPKTRKVWTRNGLTDSIHQYINYHNVFLYNKYLIDFIDDNKIDDSKNDNINLIKVNEMIPEILKNNAIYLNNTVYSHLKGDKHE